MKTRSHVDFFRNPYLSGVEACRVRQSRHVFPNHAHDHVFAVSLMSSGGSYCMGTTHSDSLVRPGDIALINPGQVHSGVPAADEPITYRMLYLDLKQMEQLATAISGRDNGLPEFETLILRNHPARMALDCLLRLLENPAAPPAGRIEEALLECMGRILAACGGRQYAENVGDSSRILAPVKRFLSSDLSEKITLEMASEQAGLSRYHFLRVFKAATGLSPHAYRTQCRVEHAKALLKDRLPFSHVALECGFTDQSHFTNTFRRYVGATPRQYQADAVC